MAGVTSTNENSQELEEGEINDDIVTESVVNSETSSELKPISEPNKHLFGCVDIDLRNPDGRRPSLKAKEKLRLVCNSNFFRSSPFPDHTHGNVTRPQNTSSATQQKSRKHRNTSYSTPRTRKCSTSRMDKQRTHGGKSKFHTRTRYLPRQHYNMYSLPSSARKVRQAPHVPNTNFKIVSGVTRPDTYSSKAGHPNSLNGVDQEATYEDLLDQYKFIKLELGRLKKEEAKLTEQENERGSGESRHGSGTPGKGGGTGNDKENRHQRQRHSRSPSKGKSKANRTDSILHAKNKLENHHSSVKAESPKESVQGKDTPNSSCEEEEDEMELRRMALASRNNVNNNNNKSASTDPAFNESYMKRRVSRENSNQKVNSHNMDNYESVDMDLDSDCMAQATDLSEVEMDTSDDNQENMQEDDEDELLLREQLLRSLERRRNLEQVQKANNRVRNAKPEAFSPTHKQGVSEITKEIIPTRQNTAYVQSTVHETVCSNAVPTLPPLPSLVINLAEDSSTDESEGEKSARSPQKGSLLDGLDSLLREARQKTEVPLVGQNSTPAAVSKLSKAQQLEYRKLKAEIAKRELHQPKVIPVANYAQPLQNVPTQQLTASEELSVKEQNIQLESCELRLKAERQSLVKGKERLGMLQQLLAKRKRLVDLDTRRLDKLREEMAALEASLSKNSSYMMKINSLVQGARGSVSKHMLSVPKLERECNRLGRLAHGPSYKLPPSSLSKNFAAKRRVSLTSTAQLNATKKQRLTGNMTVTVANPHVQSIRSSAELLAEKDRLQRLEQDIAQRLEELRMKSSAGSPKPQTRKISSDPVKLLLSQQLTIKQTQEKLHFQNNNHDEESTNELEKVHCTEQMSNIQLKSVYNIEETRNEINPCNNYVRIEDKTGFTMHNLEPTYVPVAMSLNFSPFHASPDPAGKITFCPLRLKDKVLRSFTAKGVGFKFYKSCLQHFSTYRLNPRFKSENGQTLSCNAFTSKVNIKIQLCKFDLTGTCNDDQCKWQHSKNYVCSPVDTVADLLSFCPEIAGVAPSDSREVSQRKLYDYGSELLKSNSPELEDILENISKDVCRRLCINPPHYIWLYKRNMKHRVLACSVSSDQEEGCKEAKTGIKCGRLVQYQEDSFVDPETDVRYFEPEKGFNGLEDYLVQNPNDTKLWLKLASHCINSDVGGLESLNRALNVLSRALETNRQDTELWQRYLTLFSGHPDSKDILSLCQQALKFTKHYFIWWKYLELSEGFQSKSQICRGLLAHLLSPEGVTLNSDRKDLSHRLLETFLYLIQLCIQTGRMKMAVALYKKVLLAGNTQELSQQWSLLSGILSQLTASDAVLAWLCFIHLLVYSVLPSCLFQGGTNQPSVLAHKEPFVIIWPKELKAGISMISLLNQAIRHCTNVASSSNYCWPLHQSLLQLHIDSGRLDLAIQHCTDLCKSLPDLLQTWFFLANLYLKEDSLEKSLKVLQDAFEVLPPSPQLCNCLATYYFKRGFTTKAINILTDCVKPYVELPDFEEDTAGLIYKLLLNHHHGEDIPLPIFEKHKAVEFTEEETTYLWLNYVLYLECAQATNTTIVDVFESAIVSIKQQSNLELIWWRYLQYSLESSECDGACVQDLVFQCLRRLPTSQPLVHWPGRTRLSYRFHNMVIQMYCQVLNSLEDRIAFCQHLLQYMPMNEGLLHRLIVLILEWEGPREALEVLASHLGEKLVSPNLWRIAISLAYKEGDFNEVRKLYHKALQVIPYTRCLWLDVLLLEGPEKEKVEPWLVRSAQLGILGVDNSQDEKGEEFDTDSTVCTFNALTTVNEREFVA